MSNPKSPCELQSEHFKGDCTRDHIGSIVGGVKGGY